MLTSYHVHSNFSDGQNTIEEMVLAAVKAGVNEIGLSDHYVIPTDGRIVPWSMPLDAIPQYLSKINEAETRFGNKIIIRKGIEADFDPSTVEELREILSQYPFDYVIGSVHFINGFPIDEHEKYWDDLNETQRNEVIRDYWNRISLLVKSGAFDIVAHMDLYKKFGAQPTIDISDDIISTLDVIAESGMAVELNTAGWHKPIREAYPSSMIIRGCQKRGIPIIPTADAHTTADITRDIDRAKATLKSVGYTQQAIFTERQQRLVELV